ncbi:MAG: glycosyl hydrolase 53 family protein [Terracidiphilus sp.]|jgi:arabinogalactan endo-1,4-beta-galactosidase
MKISSTDDRALRARLWKPGTGVSLLSLLLLGFLRSTACWAQQPAEPVDISPIDGETYYFINQLSGLQMDLDNGSTASGMPVLIESRSFTSLSQRWAMTKVSSGVWAISNLGNGLCLDSATSGGSTSTVQNPCSPVTTTQQWSLSATSNGYRVLTNQATGLVLDVSSGSSAPGAALNQTAASASPTQSQQWLLRPAFFRGVDNALLEKQEADRVSASLPWWTDAGTSQDVLQILKDHGINLVRIRPTSVPPYQTYTVGSSLAVPATCTGNGCYAETDSADLDLAKRAKQLGMAVELTLFFDGGSSTATPGEWSSYTLSQAQTAVYNYVKAEVEAYRSAGVMPDMVTIGNEVDTGFFGSLASPTGSNFSPFAALQIQGMQAVLDAASDTSIGASIPPPLRCIHITPSWDLTNFFGYVNSNSVPYDAVCQSYYPIYHGPLTTVQAATSNPNKQPVEQTALTTAANSIAKPIFLIEVGEHYENGFDSNDPWYPATVAGQRQFLIDVNSVLKGLPDNLGMGVEYWDPEGVNTAKASGSGYTAADGTIDATYTWNGLTLFDNADTSGNSLSTAANYSAILGGADALGGKIDSTLAYKLVNVSSGKILEISGSATSSGTPLDTVTSNGGATIYQQWSITSNGDGYLQIANLDVPQGTAALVLDNSGSSSSGSTVVLNAATGTASQQWNLVTAGNGYYTIVNKSSGLVLAATGTGAIQQQSPSSTSLDWITPVNQTQLWQVTPVHITAASPVAASTTTMLSTSAVTVNPGQNVTLTATVTSSSATPTGTVNFLNGSSQLGSATLNAGGIATYTGTLSPGTNSISAAYLGNINFAASSSAAVIVTEPNFSVTANQSSLTFSPGSNGSVSLTLTPVGGYTGTITPSCGTTLSGVSCSFNPTSYSADGSDKALTGTVVIAASSSAAALHPFSERDGRHFAEATLFLLPSGVFLLLIAFQRRRLMRNLRTTSIFLLLALLGVAGELSACGGGGGGGGTQQPVTGTVTIVAAGSTGNVSQSVQITVTVQ